MDVDGRVIRFDTISKFIAPGMRLGWIVGPPSFIDKYILLQSTTSQFPCSIAQSMFLGLMKHWGDDKLHVHLQKLQHHYIQKCQLVLDALKLYVSTDHCTYIVPTGGMFIWVQFPRLKGKMTAEEVFKELVQFNIIAVPSSSFYVHNIYEVLTQHHDSKKYSCTNASAITASTAVIKGSENEIPGFRVCYAAAEEDKIVHAIKLLGGLLQKLHVLYGM